MAKQPEYWVEADRAVNNRARVIGYSVWHFDAKGKREMVSRFRVTRKSGWQVALHLANAMRDDLNSNPDNGFVYDEIKMFPFVGDPHRMTD